MEIRRQLRLAVRVENLGELADWSVNATTALWLKVGSVDDT